MIKTHLKHKSWACFCLSAWFLVNLFKFKVLVRGQFTIFQFQSTHLRSQNSVVVRYDQKLWKCIKLIMMMADIRIWKIEREAANLLQSGMQLLFSKYQNFIAFFSNSSLFTLALSRSMALMSEPWKYFTRVCWRLSKPSNSRSGSALKSSSP